MLDRDFIVFGRTRVFYITDMYDIGTGIVEVVEYIDENKNIPQMEDKFTIRIKSQPENEYIELMRMDVFFSVDEAKEVLINKLKGHIQIQNDFTYTLVNFINTFGVEAYLYESDANIFTDACIKGTIVDNSIHFNKYAVQRDKHYKIILKVLDTVYSTIFTDITIYNGQFDNQIIDYLTLTSISYPIDYNYYRINVIDIPYDIKDNQFLIAIDDAGKHIVSESDYVNATEYTEDNYNVNINRFKPFIVDSDFGIQYWIPEQNKHYKVRLVVNNGSEVESYTSNEYVIYDDFISDMPMSFYSFTKDE